MNSVEESQHREGKDLSKYIEKSIKIECCCFLTHHNNMILRSADLMHLINAQDTFALRRGGQAIDQGRLSQLQFVPAGRILEDSPGSPSSMMRYKDIPLSAEVAFRALSNPQIPHMTLQKMLRLRRGTRTSHHKENICFCVLPARKNSGK